ncbi:MAG: molybdopterin-dependent oxidoreductase [Trueperaceae bacterium]|nr:MAG: molybdopterin-dependent oxidoreductase [Trueperaceae bacterium]
MKLRRREFLKLSAASVGALALGEQVGASSLPNPLARVPAPWYATGVTQSYSICENCFWKCGITAHVAGGKVFKVEGYQGNPKSRGRLCPRGQGAVAQVYDPDRLKHPLIRVEGTARGEGKYRTASWDEALDYIADHMLDIKDRYGSESMAFFGHCSGDSWFVEYLPGAWGSPNAAKPSVSLCTTPRETASQWTFGRPVGGHEPVDWENTRYIVLIGHHIGEDTHNTQLQDFSLALASGAKLVVVDPRFSTAASKADRWLPIRPGTDTALLLAWLNVLVDEELYDRDYLDRYAVGFDELALHVKKFTPEWAAPITDLPAEAIRIVARELAAHAPEAVIPPGRHTVWYGDDTQRMRAQYLVNALLGNVGRPGGFYIAQPPYLEPYPHPPFVLEPAAGGCGGAEVTTEESNSDFRPAADRGKFFARTTAIQELIPPMITGEPYPIKGLIAYGVNLFHSIPNVPRTKEALRELDLYVAIDVMPMEHVMWADVILPEASYLERHDDLVAIAHKTPFIELRTPAIEPLWDSKPGWWIARELGIRLGLEAYFAWQDIEEYLDRRLTAIGSSLEQAKQVGTLIQKGRPYLEDWEARNRSPFGTPSGKIELYSETFAQNGLDPLPVYTPPEEVPQGYYRLLYGRSPVHTFARTQNNWILMEMHGENAVWVSVAEAERQGLSNGDYVWLENQDGVREGPVQVYATERIRRDCLYLVHGFGHKSSSLAIADGRGASDNALQTRYTLDPISGGAGLRNNFVKLIPGAPRPRHPNLARLARERRI